MNDQPNTPEKSPKSILATVACGAGFLIGSLAGLFLGSVLGSTLGKAISPELLVIIGFASGSIGGTVIANRLFRRIQLRQNGR